MGRVRIYLAILAIIFFTAEVDAQFGPQQVISTSTESPHFALLFDIDNDGLTDILTASTIDSKLRWYPKLDQNGNFDTQIIINETPNHYLAIEHIDLDSDTDKDLLFLINNPNRIAWLENTDGAGNFSVEQTIIPTQPDFIIWMVLIDFDNDGDDDIIANMTDTFTDRIVWFEHIDGQGHFGSENILINDLTFVGPIVVMDIDNDGLSDILTSHENTGPARLIWYKNLGNSTLGPEQEIYQFPFFSSDLTSIHHMVTADINTDGQQDIVITSHNDDTGTYVYWIENLDDQGSFGSLQLIPNMNGGYNFYDLDNDGSLDILLWNRFIDQIFWKKNLDGEGTFSTGHLITNEAEFPGSAHASDLDADGYLDIVSASLADDKIAWYKNSGVFGVEDRVNGLFTIYPNPTAGQLIIFGDPGIKSVEIVDPVGKSILRIENSAKLDISMLPLGIYFIRIETVDGLYDLQKIIKK
ncbi:MAG: T9SS C-terminal target domain-containing protein [Flavobacterium sp.]|nr:MAG: T9SS C-terminal target domain-containing protein [Flavobacterium sp.]